jgi:hypothetical protein
VPNRAERLARNEALFREVNERIAEVSSSWGTDRAAAVCECANEGCAETIELAASEYEAVRAHGERFVLRAGHEDPEIERVVERGERFIVVEKMGDGARVARDLDPRS